MTSAKVKCKECNDSGSYEVKNAYDPGFTAEVPCEYCSLGKKLKVKLN